MSSLLHSSGNVDPELLRERLRAIADEAWRRSVTSVVEGAFICLGRLSGIDFVTLEREAPHKSPRDLWAAIESNVAEMWLALEELRGAMDPIGQSASGAASNTPSDEIDFDAQSQPVPAARIPSPEERIRETAWAMSFVLNGEIDNFRRRLLGLLKLTDGWELVSAAQDHVGHLRSAVQAVVTGVYTALPGASVAGSNDQQTIELFVARGLRTQVFELRDQVLELEAQMARTRPSDWLAVLSAVHKSVEAFMFSAAFGWLRAGDKRSFLSHQRSVAEILAMWTPLRAQPARQVVSGVARYLEALEVINQRECLVTHDRRALTQVVQSLRIATAQRDADGRAALGRGLAALAEAQGRDRLLDELLAQTLAPGSPAPLQAILERAETVLASLGKARED